MTTAAEKKWKCPAKAKQLLAKVKQLILEEPKRFDMDAWGRREIVQDVETQPACGTTACIAGWAWLAGAPATELRRSSAALVNAMSKQTKRTQEKFEHRSIHFLPFNTPNKVSELMELPYSERGQGERGDLARLFFTANWPMNFQVEFHAEQGSRA